MFWEKKKKETTQPNLFFTGWFGEKNKEKYLSEVSSSVMSSGAFPLEISAKLCKHAHKYILKI